MLLFFKVQRGLPASTDGISLSLSLSLSLFLSLSFSLSLSLSISLFSLSYSLYLFLFLSLFLSLSHTHTHNLELNARTALVGAQEHGNSNAARIQGPPPPRTPRHSHLAPRTAPVVIEPSLRSKLTLAASPQKEKAELQKIMVCPGKSSSSSVMVDPGIHPGTRTAHMRTQTHTRTKTPAQAYTHTHTPAHRHTHTRMSPTHTHAHTQGHHVS